MVNRRGFIRGLGALLATTALVRPALPTMEAATAAGPEEVLARLVDYYFDRFHKEMNEAFYGDGFCRFWFDGHDIRFVVPPVSQQTVDETLPL